jgi:hypothetical protein
MSNETQTLRGTCSLFADFWQKTPATRDVSFADVFQLITAGSLADRTQQLRSTSDAPTVDKLKKQLPFLTVSSRYDEAATGKGVEQPIAHSGYVCFDFDHLPSDELQRLQTAFRKDGKTELLFVSPRGEGLKRVVKVNDITASNHEQVYYCLVLHHYRMYKAVADETCVNLNRGTFLPHDAAAYFNTDATSYDAVLLLATYPDAERKAKFLVKQFKPGGDTSLIPADLFLWELPPVTQAPKKSEKKPVVKAVGTGKGNAHEVAQRLVQGLKENGGSITHDFADWLKVGAGLKNELGEAGFTYFDELSQQDADKYDAHEVKKAWNSLEIRPEGTPRANAGTLVLLGRENGVEAVKVSTAKPTDNRQKVTQMDIRDAVKQLYTLYFDAGTETYYYATPGNDSPFLFVPFTAKSTFLNELLGDLEQEQVFTSKAKLEESIFNKGCYTVINYLPLQLDWLAQHYDGTDQVTPLLASVTTEDDALFALQTRKWLVNLVAQMYGHDATSRNDNALILVGEQGIGKTGFFEFLLWDDKWFATKPDFNFENKNHLLLMNQKVLILLDEMGQYNKADIKILKAAFSQTKITADRKFHETADYKRNASFAGCSNNSDFLKDDTGDRRFLVFQMLGYDRALYNGVDKAQLWGQLVTMYKAGFDYHFSQDEVRATVQRNLSAYTVWKPEDTFVQECLEVTGEETDFLSNADLEKLLNRYRAEHHVRDFMAVSSIRAKLKMQGALVGQQKKIAGKVVKGYVGVRPAQSDRITDADMQAFNV